MGLINFALQKGLNALIDEINASIDEHFNKVLLRTDLDATAANQLKEACKTWVEGLTLKHAKLLLYSEADRFTEYVDCVG